MRKVIVCLAVSLVAFAGCGKSGTKPVTPDAGGESPLPGPASTDSALSSAADLGAKSLEGANPPPVVDAVITDGGTVIRRFGADPDSLNPVTGRDAYGNFVLDHVTERLAARNLDTLEFEPRLAESWELSDDHLTYTFHLRKDVKWHDGKPFTSDDVIYTMERIMDPKVDAPQLRNYLEDLESFVAVDKYTVQFKWKKPYFLSMETCAEVQPIPNHVFDDGQEFNSHPAGRKPVGTGMFRFIAWKAGEEIVLERNEDYYGRKPHIKGVTFRIVADDNAALQQAASGVIDIMGVLPEQWVKELPRDVYRRNFNRYYYYLPNYSYIGWNEKRAFFADVRVRRAMTHLVNRDAMLANILYGLGKVVTGTFYINSKDYSPEVAPLPFDPVEAARLLEEAGWKDSDGDGVRDKLVNGATVPLSCSLMYPSGRGPAEQMAVLFQEEARKAGIEVNVRNLEWAAFIEKLNEADFDAVTLGWSLGVEQDPYQLWHSSQVGRGSNSISFNNPDVDRIIEEARAEFDVDKRVALYHRFNYILHDEQPYTFLFCSPSLVITNRRVHNLVVHKLGLDVRDWYIPAELQR